MRPPRVTIEGHTNGALAGDESIVDFLERELGVGGDEWTEVPVRITVEVLDIEH